MRETKIGYDIMVRITDPEPPPLPPLPATAIVDNLSLPNWWMIRIQNLGDGFWKIDLERCVLDQVEVIVWRRIGSVFFLRIDDYFNFLFYFLGWDGLRPSFWIGPIRACINLTSFVSFFLFSGHITILILKVLNFDLKSINFNLK